MTNAVNAARPTSCVVTLVGVAILVLFLGTSVEDAAAARLPVKPPAVVGDSLTVGAQPYLPTSWKVDARNGRSLHESVTLLGTGDRRGARCIVVALGSNDVSHDYSAAQMTADVQRANGLMRNHRCVLWTTVKVDGVAYYGPGWRRFALQWNQIVRTQGMGDVLDWNIVARAHPEYFLGDGLHMTVAGRAAYARFLRAGVRDHLLVSANPAA